MAWLRIGTRPNTSRCRPPQAMQSRLRLVRTPGRNGGAKGTVISTKARSGWSARAAGRPRRPHYEQLTKGGAKDAWPMWGGDGKTLYFMSDRNGAQNIWSTGAAVPGTAKPLTSSRTVVCCGRRSRRTGRRLPSNVISASGRSTPPPARRMRSRLRCAARRLRAARRASYVHRIKSRNSRFRRTARKLRSPCTARFFPRRPKDGGDGVRLTTTAGEEAEIAVGARQPADRVCVASGRHQSPFSVRLQLSQGDAAHVRSGATTTFHGFRLTANGSHSSANHASCV